jgi:hypothetical protein
VNLVRHFFEKLDFRRFNVEMTDSIPMDDTSNISKLTEYGNKLGQKILTDKWEEMDEPLKTVVLG